MKNLLRSLLCAPALLLAAHTASAQGIPNAGLETWEPRANNIVESPQGWYTTDDFFVTLGAPSDFGTVTRSTESRTGSAAAQLETKVLNGTQGPFRSQAALVLGTPANTDLRRIFLRTGGIAYTGRPTSLNFWYKANIAANDEVIAGIILTKNGQPIGNAASTITPQANTNTYTLGSLPIQYSSTEAPDTLRIFYLVGNATATGVTSFSVDDLSLAGVVASSGNPQLKSALSVYPNPSTSGEFSLASLSNPGVATAPFTVTDALGRVVLKQGKAASSLANGRPVDLRNQQPGVYLLLLETPEGPVTQKLVVR